METMEEDNDDNAADYDLKSLEIVILPMSPKMEDIVDNYCWFDESLFKMITFWIKWIDLKF